MSQLAAERPRPASNKPSLGGLIKSSLLYAVLSAIPSAKRTVTDANSLANFANYDATYGSLGAAIGTTIWMWMSSVLFCSAPNSTLRSSIKPRTTRLRDTNGLSANVGPQWRTRSVRQPKASRLGPAEVPGFRTGRLRQPRRLVSVAHQNHCLRSPLYGRRVLFHAGAASQGWAHYP